MKKLMCILILLAFFGSTLIMTGCLGGSSSGGILAAAVFVLAITASGGSGAAVFAANERVSIRPAISVAAQDINIKVFPLDAAGAKVGTGVAITKDKITVDASNQIVANTDISTADGYNQYVVEVYSGDKLLMKTYRYINDGLKTGTVKAHADAESMAKALVYDKWNTAGTARSYSDFEYNLAKANIAANITAIKTQVETKLNTFAGDTTQTPDFTTLDPSSTTAAGSVANTSPGVIISGTNDTVIRSHPLQFSESPVFTAWDDKRPSFFGIENPPTINPWRIGNERHFTYDAQNPQSNEQVIAYAGDGVELSAANTVPSEWFTNSYQAKGMKDLAVGDVYYVRIQQDGTWYYGAIKVTEIPQTTDISQFVGMKYDFKYNREPSNTNITVTQ